MRDELGPLYERIDDMEIAMMTTRRADGQLESRPMATQKRVPGADLWFVTAEDTSAVEDLERDPVLNLAFYKDSTREWVSVSGRATLTRDRDLIGQLYAADWKIWFSDEGDPRHGTPDDPRLVLIGVEVQGAAYLELNKPRPVVLYEMVKGLVTGDTPEVGETHVVTPGRGGW